tara:strand:+ start:182 stop:523 length:342 start_codon:yes stop_codon:yes gene_type:complete
MSKIKILFVLIIIFVVYKGFVAIKNFEIGVENRVAKIVDIEGFERSKKVIALIMYIGEPLEINEHLLVSSEEKCLELKENAESNSNAYYECAVVDAIINENKILEIIKEIEVL